MKRERKKVSMNCECAFSKHALPKYSKYGKNKYGEKNKYTRRNDQRGVKSKRKLNMLKKYDIRPNQK